jgi:hypothetical protein
VSPGLPGDRGLSPCFFKSPVASTLQQGDETGGNEKKTAAREGARTALLRNGGRRLGNISCGRLLGNNRRQRDDSVAGLLSRGVVNGGVVVSVNRSRGGANAGGLILGEGGVDGGRGGLLGLRFGCAAGRSRSRRAGGRGRGLGRDHKATSDSVGSSAGLGVHALGAAESLVLLIVSAVVASLAGVAVATGAADLTGGRVEAVNGLVSGSALGEALAASAVASGCVGVVALSLLGLVPVAVAAGKALARKGHESHATSRLVGHRAGGADGRDGAGQDCDGGGEVHLDGCFQVLLDVVGDSNVRYLQLIASELDVRS